MYRLNPPAVYVHESVATDSRYKARIDRVVAALDPAPPVVVYRDENLPAMIQDKGLLKGRVRMGSLRAIPDPILLFNTFRFDGRRSERAQWLRRACGEGKAPGGHTLHALTGYEPFDWTDIEDLKAEIDPAWLVPEYVAAAEQAREAMKEEQSRPFPHEVRAEIYEHHIREIRKRDAEVPISLSTESPVVWKMLSSLLEEGPATYVCGCGPNATPGRRRLTCNPFQITADGPQGGFEAM